MPVRRLVEIFLNLARNTRQAKVGTFEVLTERKRADLSALLTAGAGWRDLVLHQLDTEHVSLLLQIHKVGAVSPQRAMPDVVRDLRSHALVHHDGSTLATATEIRLTVLGEDRAESLATSRDPLAASKAAPTAVPADLKEEKMALVTAVMG